jgi:ribonuclease HII
MQNRMPPKKKQMLCSYEVAARSVGLSPVCGVDEAGRGPLAGPVVAAAVIMPPGCNISGINDSKKIAPKRREKLYELITETAVAYKIAHVEVPHIDKINILQASLLAMKKAVEGLGVRPGILFVDGNFKVPDLAGQKIAQIALKDGDALCMSIAAASILAKVSRDRRMAEYEELYPGYGFASNKGYGTADHMESLRRLGPSPIHRRSFEPVKGMFENRSLF